MYRRHWQLIEAIRALIASIWSEQKLTCAITAPTGLAAFNVGGVTVHRLFQLPIEHEGRTVGYWSLSKESQKTLSTSLRHVNVFIVDEVSMVFSLDLAYLHLRLENYLAVTSGLGVKTFCLLGTSCNCSLSTVTQCLKEFPKSHSQVRLCHADKHLRDSVVYDEVTINDRQKRDEGSPCCWIVSDVGVKQVRLSQPLNRTS